MKTHAGFRARQTGPGVYAWRTPLGQYLLVDHTGTHPLDPSIGRSLLYGSPAEVRLAEELARHLAA